MADFGDSTFVVPGQFITSEKTYLRGHGSFIQDSSEGYQLLSCVAGQIERIDKLIAVKPVKFRLGTCYPSHLVVGIDLKKENQNTLLHILFCETMIHKS